MAPRLGCRCPPRHYISFSLRGEASNLCGLREQPPPATPRERIEALPRRLGEEHPEALAAMLDLAEMLWARGRLAEVRALEEHVVDARRRALGETHGDTLKALGKLAATIGAEGDLAEARRL